MQFNSEDFPTPLCPATTLARPANARRKRSMPKPLLALSNSTS